MSDTIKVQFSVRSKLMSNNELIKYVQKMLELDLGDLISDIKMWEAGTIEDYARGARLP
jgi:hypothetical protein